jgi:dTMP kinase
VGRLLNEPASRGRFITLEGGEGAGKSTQAERLVAWLARVGIEALATREPGGTRGGEAIRQLLLGGSADRWGPAAELMLVNAARADHVERVVRPALGRGVWVVCDRYVDSSRVYQGLVGGCGLAAVDRLHDEILHLPWPDLTLLLDLDPQEGIRRREGSGSGVTRFEQKGDEFHRKVRDGFLQLAAAEPDRMVLIDAALPLDAVADRIRGAVDERFSLGAG